MTLIHLLLSAALATTPEPAAPAPPPTAAKTAKPSAAPDPVVKAVSTVYGKPVPAAAICTEPAKLPDDFAGSPAAVGVMRGAAGCRLIGVLVDGAFHEPAEAAKVSLGERWEKANRAHRESLLEAWTEQVLLAFDQLDPEVEVEAAPGTAGGVKVKAKLWQRTDERHVARHTDATFYFDQHAQLESSDREGGEDWRTAFYVQHVRVDGVSQDAVMNALTQQGRTMTGCMDQAWKQDLTVEGRVKLQWTIRDKVATQIAMVEDGEEWPGREEVANCYGSALRKIQFPEGMGGTVVWSFSIVRGRHTAE